MTPLTVLRRFGAPLASAAATALMFTAALWVQRARGGWPFDAAPAAPQLEGLAGMEAAPRPVGELAVEQARPEPDRGTGGGSYDRVSVEAAAARSIDIRLETVGRQSLTQAIRAVATIVPDESRISHVHTRVAGWIERLDVNTTGEMVRAGQPLAHIFSQELLSSQIEYLAARRSAAASGITSAVVASGRTRLTVLGMTSAEVHAVEQTGEPRRLVTVVAPRSGVVVNRGVTVGTSVDPATPLLTVADLSRVWVLVEVPEASIPAVHAGLSAELDFPASGRPPFAARVDFVYPTLTERTRTLRVRLSAANPGGALRPGLYGTATFQSARKDVITVPRDAIVDTGLQQHVFVAVGDRFEPRPVAVGIQLADRVEIREGLEEGERIVAAGVFLLDSESRLRATGGGGGHSHGAPSGDRQAPAEPAPDRPAVRKPARPESSTTPADPHAAHQAPPEPPADPHAGHRE
jgi:Cu(I)/Ag(I) efflux system membrane fusion protein